MFIFETFLIAAWFYVFYLFIQHYISKYYTEMLVIEKKIKQSFDDLENLKDKNKIISDQLNTLNIEYKNEFENKFNELIEQSISQHKDSLNQIYAKISKNSKKFEKEDKEKIINLLKDKLTKKK